MNLTLDVPCTLTQTSDPVDPFPIAGKISQYDQYRFYGRFVCYARSACIMCDAHLWYLPNDTRNSVLVVMTEADYSWRRIRQPVDGLASNTYREYIAHAMIQEHFTTEGWWSFVNKYF